MKKNRVAAVVLLPAAAAALAVGSLWQPYAGFAGDVFVDIPKGTGTLGVAGRLAAAGVVRYRWQPILARAFRPGLKLQAGEYRFSQSATTWQVIDRVRRCDVFFYELSIPEGFNIYQVAESVEHLGLASQHEFLAAARDPTPIRDLAPEAASMEGYLFPATYRVTRQTSPAQIVAQMSAEFRRHWKQLGAPADANRIVTLASLVEKETSLAAERPLVAGVFLNRLSKGMALECDPSVIYAALLAGNYRGAIYRSDLERDHPYNTYAHAGLPPGPIANPGLESLKAALHPAGTGYLYFVAKPGNSGGHRFSAKLEMHARAVQDYRRGARKTEQARNARQLGRRPPAAKR